MTARIIHCNWFKIASVLFVLSFFVATSSQTALATAGINRTINFQGKVVNKTTGLNVADGNYDFTFKLYNVSSAGSPIWTENWTAAGGGQLAVTNGIFRASLGSFTTFASANVDFNNDSLYLDITFNGETMGSRVQLTAVPYALNAEKVAGLTVTNNGGNTLNIAANKTFTVNNTITFGGTDSTSFTLPSSTDTLVGLAASQILTNKTIGSTGLTFSGATTDVTTGTNEAFTILPNGSGNIGLGTTTTAGFLTVGNSGRTPNGKALAVFDQYETNGDLFTASASGTTKFTVLNNGQVQVVNGTANIPTYGFKSDTTTGVYLISSQKLGLSAAGNMLTLDGSVGSVGIGTVSPTRGKLEIAGSGDITGLALHSTATNDPEFDLKILGTGATPYGVLSVGDSLAYRNLILSPSGGNIGIGTTTTAGLLTVGNSGRGLTGKSVAIFDQYETADILTGSASGTPKFVFNNGGNLGIGTALPSRKLQLVIPDASTPIMNIQNQTGEILDITGAGAVTFGNSGNNNSGGMYNFGVGGSGSYINSASGDYVSINAGTSNVGRLLNVQQNSVSRFIVLANGNVGIGTTTTAGQLTVGDSGRTPIGKALVVFDQYDTNADIFAASGSGTNKFVIDKGGNVGIGSTLPASFKLEVAGNIGPSADITYDIGSASKRIRTLYLAGQGSPSNPALYFNDNFNNGGVFYTSTSVWALRTNDANSLNIGLFTSTSVGDNAGSFVISNNINGASTNRVTFYPDGSQASGPNYSSYSKIGAYTLQGNYKGNALMVLDQRSTQDIFVASVSGTTKFILANSGNVAIGTTSTSSYNLDVTGTARFTGAITVASCTGCGGGSSAWSGLTAPSGNLSLSMSTNTTTFNWATGTSSNNLFSLTTDATTNGTGALLNVQTGATSSTVIPLRVRAGSREALYVDTGGNVGMGTTSPTTGLYVVKDTTGLNGVVAQFDGSTGQGAAIMLRQPSYNAWVLGMTAGGTDFTFQNNAGTGGYSNIPLIISGSGNIGINTTSPFTVLDVEGGNLGGRVAMVVNQLGASTNDIFTASASGTPKFTILNGGSIKSAALSNSNGVLYVNSSGQFANTSTGGAGTLCLTSVSGAAPSFGSCSGSASTTWSNLSAPSAGLSLSMGTNTTTFNWATGTSTNNLFNLTSDASANGTGSLLNVNAGASSALNLITAQTGTNQAFTVTSNGNVGYGTLTPSYKMVIWGNESTANGGGAAMQFSNKSTGGGDWYFRAGATGTSTPAGGISLANNSAYWWSIDSTGLMSVGSNAATNPKAQLYVSGGSQGGNAALIVDQTGASTNDILTASASGSTRFTITNNGNMGVGTTRPREKTEVSGNVLVGGQADATSSIASLNSAAGTWGSQTSMTGASSSAVFKGKLFVAVSKNDGAGVYRYDGGTTWTLVTNSAGKAVSTDTANIDGYILSVYNGGLYIGSQTGQGTGTGALYVSTTADTTADSFTLINTTRGRFLTTTAHDGISDIEIWNGALYIATQKLNAMEVLKYSGGTGTSVFTLINVAGKFGTGDATANLSGALLQVYNGRLWGGGQSGTGIGKAHVSVYDGSGATWVNTTSTTLGTIGSDTAVDDISSMAVYNGSMYVGTAKANAANIYRWTGGAYEPVTNSPTLFVKLNSASGQIISGDTASSIQSVTSLKPYNGRLYVGVKTSNLGALYEFDGTSAFTLVNGTRGTFGSETSVDNVDNLIEFNGTLYIGTEESTKGSVYTFTKTVQNSYALKFESGSGTNNYGSISFVGNEQTNDHTGHQGTFLFSNSLAMGTGAFDYAEDYPTNDTSLMPGDLVSVDPSNPQYIQKATAGSHLIGVISENPGFRLQQKQDELGDATWMPVALVGRVPVSVSTENGEIKSGDYLTSSSIPGVAMKATKAGQVIGQAMEGYSGSDLGKITVFIANSTYNGSVSSLVDGLEGQITNDSGITTMSTDPDAKLLVGLLNQPTNVLTAQPSEIVTDALIATKKIVTPKVVTDQVLLNSLSPATGKDVTVHLGTDGTLVLVDDAGNPAISFDAKGNAHFAGTITADKIQANQIAGLEFITGKLASLSADLVSVRTSLDTTSTVTASVSGVSTSTVQSSISSTNSLTLSSLSVEGLATMSADLRVKGNGLFEGILTVIDTLNVHDLFVNGMSDFVGNVIFHNNATFKKHVNFASDSAGVVTVKKGDQKVDVIFTQEYSNSPIVTTSIALDHMDDADIASASATALFGQDYKVLVVQKSTKGFTILLNKPASDDLHISWTAIGVDENGKEVSK